MTARVVCGGAIDPARIAVAPVEGERGGRHAAVTCSARCSGTARAKVRKRSITGTVCAVCGVAIAPAEKQIRHGTHRSAALPGKAVTDHLDIRNQDLKPFRWTKSADDIPNAVKSYCETSA